GGSVEWTCSSSWDLHRRIVGCRSRISGGSRDAVEQREESLAHHPPAVARAAEVAPLIRPESGLHDRETRPGGDGLERDRHDGVQLPDGPRVADLPPRLDLEEAAVDRAVPAGLRRRLQRERRPWLELEAHH